MMTHKRDEGKKTQKKSKSPVQLKSTLEAVKKNGTYCRTLIWKMENELEKSS